MTRHTPSPTANAQDVTATHTPGPWAVSKQASRRVTNTHGVVICNAVLRNNGTFKAGHKQGTKLASEAEANARLIAAAPELLDVLLEAAEFIQPFNRAEALLDKIDAAIAKATAA